MQLQFHHLSTRAEVVIAVSRTPSLSLRGSIADDHQLFPPAATQPRRRPIVRLLGPLVDATSSFHFVVSSSSSSTSPTSSRVHLKLHLLACVRQLITHSHQLPASPLITYEKESSESKPYHPACRKKHPPPHPSSPPLGPATSVSQDHKHPPRQVRPHCLARARRGTPSSRTRTTWFPTAASVPRSATQSLTLGQALLRPPLSLHRHRA